MTCGWHISSTVSADRTAASGSARNAAHRPRSLVVDHSSAAGANALPGNSCSGSSRSAYGSVK